MYNVVRSLHNTYTSNKEYKERERGGGEENGSKEGIKTYVLVYSHA